MAELPRSLLWMRPYGWRRPGMEDTRKPGIYRLPADAAALRVMVESQLGRPSTWPDHVKNFVGRELVDADMKLTAKGRFWLQSTPAALLDPKTSQRIEDVLNRAGGQGRSGGPERSGELPDPAPVPGAAREDDRPPVDPTPWVSLTHRAIVKLPKTLRGRIAELCLEPVPQQVARAEAIRASERAAADALGSRERNPLSRGLQETKGDQARFAEAEK